MTDSASSNAPEFTVSELSFALKRTVEDAYGYVRVRGEISSYRGPHSSGHAYFCLKDESARIDAVVWRGSMQRLRFKPEEGLEVVATGKLTTYPGKSTYQIVIDQLEPAGVGALMALLEERRKKLAAEGLFDASRKQLLPDMPRVIGVVTSPTGAVIRDILHRISDRFPAHVVVWPVRVQGESAAAEVAAAIRGFNALSPDGPVPRPEVLVVARGGGSLEDLWAFNEEIVVRAAAESEIPLVSAVGHETDTTLIDFAADLRAPTPTAAAELVMPVRAELLDRTGGLGLRLGRAISRLSDDRRRHFAALARALPRPEALLALPRQRLDAATARLPRALVAEVQRKRLGCTRVASRLTPALGARASERGRDRLAGLGDRLARCFEATVTRRRERFDRLAPRLSADLLARPLPRLRERVTSLADRSERAHRAALARRSDRLRGLADLMRALSYRSVLDRGFALVRAADGTPLRSVGKVAPGAALEIEFADGRITAMAAGRLARGRPARGGGAQDDLFG
jgi:exodeoxyribonuclease VII large subunit